MDKEVPYGQVMMDILLNRGFMPEIVVEEESPNATHHRRLFQERLGGQELAPSIESQVKKHRLRYERVADLCGPECEQIIKKEDPDIVALGGTRRFIKPNIFTIPSWATLCSHPGLLPLVRGAASPAWSILHDIQVGCSCFVVDEGLDTGPVIKSKIVPVFVGDTYGDVVKRNIVYCGELMGDVLEMFQEKNGPIQGEPQDLSIGKTYKTMPQELILQVIRKLKEKDYKWLETSR